ncbi:Zinc finger A20 and AN1 domain-containing stress-associated protein 4 [Apostasia shenzhenica]|uniref:Zinc finger A20 and AN1 domain-containing stress-associated protein 4 n=1 Tax=Apostasia shenzhenica TaxID=1088818 RepID=A0A2I0BD78_9ASPA|nr:Zinc finger A20 and AN1 domain-containing stress-associated protein 4 [Apostasia shenzhenica]
MAEEQRCQEGHRLCANNCGFFGSPATMNLCSKCFRDLRLKEEQVSSAKIAVEKSLLTPSPSAVAADPPPTFPSLCESSSPAGETFVRQPPAKDRSVAMATTGRCSQCRKKVGLTGFRCRCELTFCGKHRYPEQHGCSFNFKAAGREAIARANPIVKAAKLDKI